MKNFYISLLVLSLFSETLPANTSTNDIKSKIIISSITQPPITATLDDAAWLVGSWLGSRRPGHQVQHIVLDQQVNQLPGFVRSFEQDKILFYEITTFAETGDSISYRVKHFSYDLTGWEKQDEVINRDLIGKSENLLQFDGLTFERTSVDTFTVYFRIPEGPSEGEILVIPFKRYAPQN